MKLKRCAYTFVLAVFLLFVLVTSATNPVAAQEERVDVEVEEEYNGISEDGNQVIEMTVTITAQEPILGMTVRFDETDEAFIDQQSFSVTVSDPDWENPEPKTYEIPELDSGEQITFSFDAYPRELAGDTIEPSAMLITADNPRNYRVSESLEANLSSSPWIQYQNAQTEINDLEQRVNDLESAEGNGGGLPWVLIALGVIALLGVAAAVYNEFSKRSAVDKRDRNIEDVLDELQFRVNSQNAKREIEEVKQKEEWKDRNDDILD